MTDEVLIKCVNCKNFPNSCGYWKSKHKKHTCKGFIPAEEMTLHDTIYNMRMFEKGTDKNSQLIGAAVFFLEQYKKIIKEA